jgi:hypothetical protein
METVTRMSPDEEKPDATPAPEGDEEVLDLELEPEQVLDVVLDEEPEQQGEDSPQADPHPPAAEGTRELPPVEEAMVSEAQAEELEAVCAYTRQPFAVSALPGEKGDYEVVGAKPLPPGTPVGVPPGQGRTLSGVFHLARYQGCPHCGAGGLVLCEACRAISCGATNAKTGQILPCPVCGNAGPVGPSKGWTVSVAGKGKKGKGKAS